MEAIFSRSCDVGTLVLRKTRLESTKELHGERGERSRKGGRKTDTEKEKERKRDTEKEKDAEREREKAKWLGKEI